MSRFEPSARRPIFLSQAFSLIFAALILSSCGFRPVYGPAGAEAPSPTDQLAAIRIDPLRERAGQKLHNYLRDRLNPDGQPVEPAYRLLIHLSSSTKVLAFRSDNTGTRATITLSSDFALRSIADGRILYTGQVRVGTGYNILNEAYPTNVSATDAVDRGLRELSDGIALRLAVYFSTEGDEL